MTNKQEHPSLLFWILIMSNIVLALCIGLIKNLNLEEGFQFPLVGTLIVLAIFVDAIIVERAIGSFIKDDGKAEDKGVDNGKENAD